MKTMRSQNGNGVGSTRFAFLAETSRTLADSLDFHSTLATVSNLALPHFGTWCMVDIVERDGAIRRVAVIHPDARKQSLARAYYESHPPGRNDPIGAPRVIRTSESEFVIGAADTLDELADEEHRALLREIGASSFLMVPMRARGRTLGAVTFVSEAQRQYDDADLLLAEDLGRRCAMAIDNSRLYGDAEEARIHAEAAREQAAYAAQRAEALLAAADTAREEAETANRSKASFLTTMSHEFRTPLGIVLGYVDLLDTEVGGPVNEAQRKQLHRIRTASKHLLRLIEEILTISQVNAGHGNVRLEMVDLSALLRDAAALLEPMAEAKHLALPLVLPAEAVRFPTDPGKFRQIVFNLVANALKFTTTGEVRITLAVEENTLVLQVSDTGVGISHEDAEHLFESFWQVRGGSRQTGGTGLGLTITRQLARLLGGDVSVRSEPGTGSVFTVRIARPTTEITGTSVALPAGVLRERRRRVDVR